MLINRIQWEEWFNQICPQVASEEYILTHPFRIPFMYVLQNRISFKPVWADNIPQVTTINVGFEWPSALAASMPSVTSRFELVSTATTTLCSSFRTTYSAPQ